MATASPDSPTIPDRRPIVNFSRPRHNSNATTELSKSRSTTPKPPYVHSFTAFHASSPQPDDEYTLHDPDRSNLTTPSSITTQIPWERNTQLSTQDQRHPGNAISDSSRSTTSSSLKQLLPKKSILKHTQVEQYSERADGSEAGESNGSHHTVSEEGGGGGSWDENGKWTSSGHDTSMLSEKEIQKLEKKGVNPSLYMEMKAARQGKSYVGGLTGNAYVM